MKKYTIGYWIISNDNYVDQYATVEAVNKRHAKEKILEVDPNAENLEILKVE